MNLHEMHAKLHEFACKFKTICFCINNYRFARRPCGQHMKFLEICIDQHPHAIKKTMCLHPLPTLTQTQKNVLLHRSWPMQTCMFLQLCIRADRCNVVNICKFASATVARPPWAPGLSPKGLAQALKP